LYNDEKSAHTLFNWFGLGFGDRYVREEKREHVLRAPAVKFYIIQLTY
jgi:hypothetical protein